jgi:hypothetical protein
VRGRDERKREMEEERRKGAKKQNRSASRWLHFGEKNPNKQNAVHILEVASWVK